MPVDRLPGGTRGARTPPKRLLAVLMPIMEWFHRRSGDRFRGSDLLYLTTIGARTGERRTNPVARFDDGKGGWLVVASFGGAARHPGWYHNIAAHPDGVRVEVRGVTHRVEAEQLEGPGVRGRLGAHHRPVAQLPGLPGQDRPPTAGASPHPDGPVRLSGQKVAQSGPLIGS